MKIVPFSEELYAEPRKPAEEFNLCISGELDEICKTTEELEELLQNIGA